MSATIENSTTAVVCQEAPRTEPSTLEQLQALQDEAEHACHAFRQWWGAFDRRLGKITGPLYVEAACERLLQGNTNERGTTMICPDTIIAMLHKSRYEVRYKLQDTTDEMKTAMREAVWMARAIEKLDGKDE